MQDGMREVKYVCAKCGAEDTVAYFSHETTTPVINCWKCHAGMKKSIQESLQFNEGMFPPREKSSIIGGARK
jgi:DNA-directed RNA polymerase subunit RPC12/RpoP